MCSVREGIGEGRCDDPATTERIFVGVPAPVALCARHAESIDAELAEMDKRCVEPEATMVESPEDHDDEDVDPAVST